jgi:hypothetical protein
VARVIEIATGKLLGHLDDLHCRGPLWPGTPYVEFEAWRQHDKDPWQHKDPGPSGGGLYRPLAITNTTFRIQVTNIADREIDLLLRPDEVDFIKAHPSFRAVGSATPLS